MSFLDEPQFRVRASRDGDFWNETTVTKRSGHMGDGSDRRAAGDDPRPAAGSRVRSPVAGLLASTTRILKTIRVVDGGRWPHWYSVFKEHFRIADDGKSQDQDRGCGEVACGVRTAY